MKMLILTVAVICCSVFGFAQNVKYVEEPAITELIQEHVTQKDKKPGIKGFRVQLYSSSNYENAKKVRFDFLQAYPEESAYLKYQQPNYKIRVGDFRTRLEAEKFKAKLQENEMFKACFIVPDKILYPKL